MITTTNHHLNDVIQDRYQLLEVLGQGGLGITYRAHDVVQNQFVAVKVVSLRQMKDWKILELLNREAQVLQSIDHPAIPRYIDSFEIDTSDNRAFYLVQAIAPGQPLSQWITQGWRPNEDEVQRIAVQLLEILIYLQSLNPAIIHRDLKPQNIIRDRNGKLFLVDFGAVQDTFRHTVTGGSTVVGTFGYMAPEQFRGQATLSTDLYALGATLVFLLTGIDPAELSEDHLNINFRQHIQPSHRFADWLDGLLVPAQEERIPNADAALSILQGEQVKPNRKITETIRYRRITIQHSAERLLIKIQPANIQQKRIQILSLTCIAFMLIIGVITWLHVSTPRIVMEIGDALFNMLYIAIAFFLWIIVFFLLVGILITTECEFTKGSMKIRQGIASQSKFQIKFAELYNLPLWLPYWGWMSCCCLLNATLKSGNRSAAVALGILLDNNEVELIRTHLSAFQSEQNKLF
jgi:eukaryotic-like serine/threonine-protein kinase